MEEAGLPYGKRERTYNSRLAQEFAAWGDAETDAVDRIHDALFAAYFVDNRNIGSIEVLTEIAQDLALDDKRAEEALRHRLYSPKVNEDWQRAWATGVTGVPTFTAKNSTFMVISPLKSWADLLNIWKQSIITSMGRQFAAPIGDPPDHHASIFAMARTVSR